MELGCLLFLFWNVKTERKKKRKEKNGRWYYTNYIWEKILLKFIAKFNIFFLHFVNSGVIIINVWILWREITSPFTKMITKRLCGFNVYYTAETNHI